MFKTKYGDFDGNMWEAVCQVCFKLKYETDISHILFCS